MANMTLVKTPMPEQDPKVRARNFKEVTLGYTAEMAIEEAGRCLKCKNPKCVEGCPVNVRIPEFIAKVQEGDFKAAYNEGCQAERVRKFNQEAVLVPVSEARNALDKAKVIAHYTYNRRHKRNYNQGFVNQNARRNVAENQISYNSAAEAGQK